MAAERIVVAITGGSGAPYALRLLEVLPRKPDLIISDAGRQVILHETGRKPSQVDKMAVGIGDNLVTRAAQVCLKERRKLIIVPRETPLSAIHLEQMAKLASLGVTVLVAAPPWYIRPRSLDDFTNYIAGKVLDHLGLDHDLFPRWKEGDEAPKD